MARQKFKNFEEFSALWPECSFVFVGDNGQGDVIAAELAYKADVAAEKRTGQQNPPTLRATFIHEVVHDIMGPFL